MYKHIGQDLKYENTKCEHRTTEIYIDLPKGSTNKEQIQWPYMFHVEKTLFFLISEFKL